MANRAYLVGCAQNLWAGNLVWASDNIKLLAVTAGYTPDTSVTGDQFINPAISSGFIVARSPNLTSKSSAGGVLKAANPTFPVVSGSTVTQFIMVNDTGADTTSELLVVYDTASGGLPLVPNGGPVIFQFAGAPNYVLAAAFSGLSDRDRRGMRGYWERIRRVFGDGALDVTPSGIWIGAPRIIQGESWTA